MKKYLVMLIFCGFAALAYSQAPADDPALNVPAVDNSKIYTVVEVMPAYPGGVDSLNSYLSRHVVYPQAALDAHIGGMVRLSLWWKKMAP